MPSTTPPAPAGTARTHVTIGAVRLVRPRWAERRHLDRTYPIPATWSVFALRSQARQKLREQRDLQRQHSLPLDEQAATFLERLRALIEQLRGVRSTPAPHVVDAWLSMRPLTLAATSNHLTLARLPT